MGSVTPAGVFHSPTLALVSARIASMLVVLATIPLLIHYLGGEGFAGWAVLLAASVVFSALEVGMSLTFVRHAAGPLQLGDSVEFRRVLTHALVVVVIAFAVTAGPLIWFAPSLARWLNLPDSQWLPASRMLLFVYAATLLRALLQFGVHSLNAACRFHTMAWTSFAQSFTANVAATVAAVWTGRLDFTLVAFWCGQMFVVLLTFVRVVWPQVRSATPAALDIPLLRSMSAHGLRLQVHDFAQVVSFQLDKFLIAAVLGLWAVAPYEVANRSVQALRSASTSGLDAFLATAVVGHSKDADVWSQYLSATRKAALAVLVFMVAPLTLAPVFLYAWTGEMGYLARWAFVALVVGASAQVLAIPAAAMAQVAGRAGIQARTAVITMLFNLPLSFVLMLQWHLTGAAIGTAIAMIFGAALLVVDVHRHYRQPIAPTLSRLRGFRFELLACIGLAVVVAVLFDSWVMAIDRSVRYSREVRVLPGVAAMSGYALGLILLGMNYIRLGKLTVQQQASLRRHVRWPRFNNYCARHSRVP